MKYIWTFSEYLNCVIKESCTEFTTHGWKDITQEEYLDKNNHVALGVNAFLTKEEAEERLDKLKEYNLELSKQVKQ
jgi:hypothetical protein